MLAATALSSSRAGAQATYFTPRELLADFFARSESVTYQQFDLSALSAETRERLTARLGYTPAKSRYTVYIATTRGQLAPRARVASI